MLSPRTALGIFVYVNLVSWLLLLGIRVIALLGYSNGEVFDVNFYLKGLLLNFFLLFVFFYINSRLERVREPNYVDFLSQLFVFGLVSTALSIFLQIGIYLIENQPEQVWKWQLANMFYNLNIGLMTAFLTQAFFSWKKMILHQKHENVTRTWNLFEYLLLVSLLFNFFEFNYHNPPFLLAFGLLLLMGLVLSVNLGWVAYLSAKEKWQSILLLLFISIFAYYFFYTVIEHADHKHFSPDLSHSVYVLAMFVFVFFYSIFSLLVILFHLPTTSVFEKKIEEVVSFQRLTEALQTGEKEDHVYEVLLDNAISSVKADAAWIEIRDEMGYSLLPVNRGIDLMEIQKFKAQSRRKRLGRVVSQTFARQNRPSRNVDMHEETSAFESVLKAPLVVNHQNFGTLTLLKKGPDGFDEEKRDLIKTFVRQASLAIENYRLLRKTIETERLKEEVAIAQRIQASLLPEKLVLDDTLDVEAFWKSAYEVGGDYYDYYNGKNGKITLIVGDVSGKGTNAAFDMAQMKGIFQSLAPLHLSCEEFLFFANQALGQCLSTKSFITITLLQIDLREQTLDIARAGHCPTLFYVQSEDQIRMLTGPGLGLGIIRNDSYRCHISTQRCHYAPGDVIVLYTDGIIEARNPKGEQFGYENLEKIVKQHAQASSKVITSQIIAELQNFGQGQKPHDDYTALIVKFKSPVPIVSTPEPRLPNTQEASKTEEHV
ncbi:MAG: hypothetical protein OHK0053_26600 [Microscillaceae bacterium]